MAEDQQPASGPTQDHRPPADLSAAEAAQTAAPAMSHTIDGDQTAEGAHPRGGQDASTAAAAASTPSPRHLAPSSDADDGLTSPMDITRQRSSGVLNPTPSDIHEHPDESQQEPQPSLQDGNRPPSAKSNSRHEESVCASDEGDSPTSLSSSISLGGSSQHSPPAAPQGYKSAFHTPLEQQRHTRAPGYARRTLVALGAALPDRLQRALPASAQAFIRDGRQDFGEQLFPRESSSSAPDLGGLAVPLDSAAVMRKVDRHLLTRFTILTIMCYLDRTNLAFAALQLNRDLGFSELVYGFGSSVFFVTYAIAQVPSNMILVRVGAPLWLGTIVICWGIIATCFAGLSSPRSFYVLRMLLGLFEAGTFPGLWFVLTRFYTTSEVAFAYSICQAGSVAAQVVGAPLAAGLLAMDGFLGLDGWQWLFIAEGIPTVVFGVWLWASLGEDPSSAAFLQPHERQWLVARNKAHNEVNGVSTSVEWEGVLHWKTWALATLDICISTTKYALFYFLPLIVYQILGQQMDRAEASQAGPDKDPDEVTAVLLTAIPFAAAAASTIVNAWHSKRVGERRIHVAAPLLVSAASMAVLAMTMESHAGIAFTSLMGAVMCWAPGGILSAYPSAYLTGRAAASAFALVNAAGALLGGVAGPLLVGALKHRTGHYAASVWVLSAVMFCGVIFAYYVMPIISPDECLRPVAGTSRSEGAAKDGGASREPAEQTIQLTRLPESP